MDAAPPEERAVLTLLAKGMIPAQMVEPEDFSREVSRRVARWLIEGGSVPALLERIEDDEARAEAVQAVNYTPLPEEREACLLLAQTSLDALRKARLRARMAEIEEEIKTADAQRKRELYRQMQRITQALEAD